MVIFILQQLTLNADHATDTRLNREAGDFSTFMTAGILPSFEVEAGNPSPEELIRAYLARQYPAAELLLFGTANVSGTQFTLSRYDAENDPLFPPDIRSQIRRISLDRGEDSGVLADSVRWRKVSVDGPAGPSTLVVAINDKSMRADSARVAELLVFTSIAGLLLSALMAWILAGRMIVPVRRIREAADTISADDLSRRVPSDGPDEIVALAETVNAMLARVEDSYTTQREFLDDAGHELRTPLTVVQGNLDLLPDDPDERVETTRIMQDELSRMTRIVDDLLTLARADRPDFLRTTPTDVADLVVDIEAKIDVVADRDWAVLPYAEGVAMLDQHRITQALIQFCSNAVRFTRTGDRIEIGCRVVESGEPTVSEDRAEGPVPPMPPGEQATRRLLWWVRDHGPGIPAGEEQSIFQRFHTARGQLRDGRGGTGLGLAIVSTIAGAHDGRAFAFNAAGGGAAFCIVVPFVSVPFVPSRPDTLTGDTAPGRASRSGTSRGPGQFGTGRSADTT